ncbi:MAG: thioredoxin domain-containing protein [Clostridia bacterium]|nr:thioredoxin domain-containing protein [Clostridia bacterium]
MKKIGLFTIVAIFLLFINICFATSPNLKVIYFYSETCSKCKQLEPYFKSLQESYPHIILIKYNILDLKNKALLNKYGERYTKTDAQIGEIPVVFIKNKYFIGEDNIKENLESLIMAGDGPDTMEVIDDSNDFSLDQKKFLSLKVAGVFGAGLINGLNPCSISMLLFFLSILAMNRKNILRAGISFILGKFITYFLLGTLLFCALAKVNLTWLQSILKYVMLSFVTVIFFMNLHDFFAAKFEKYGKIKLQLPFSLRKLNHTCMKRVSSISNPKILVTLSFLTGAIISLGEFLCTGQIYLATIVTVIQTTQSLNYTALFYFLLYVTAFIIPLIILTVVIYKGKEIFDVSEVVRSKMHWVKLINALLFLLFFIFIILWF